MVRFFEPTLETFLKEKYDIREKIRVEAMFMATPDLYAYIRDTGLVTLGLSKHNMYVARVLTTDHEPDYELVSVTPLSLITLGVEDEVSRRISVRSTVKAMHHTYQFCDDVEKWGEFVRAKKLINKKHMCARHNDNPARERRPKFDTPRLPARLFENVDNSSSLQGNSVENVNNSSSVQGYSTEIIAVVQSSKSSLFSWNKQKATSSEETLNVEFDHFVNEGSSGCNTPAAPEVSLLGRLARFLFH